MSDTTTNETPDVAVELSGPPGDQVIKEVNGDDLGDPGKKALDAERNARKAAEKAAKDLAAKVKAFEDAAKTDDEKNAERISGLEKQAAKALRYEAAEAADLPLKLAARLQGETLEEMVADAKALKELIGVGTADKQPEPKQQKGPHVPSEGKTPNVPSIDQQILDAEKAGNHRAAIALKQQKAFANK